MKKEINLPRWEFCPEWWHNFYNSVDDDPDLKNFNHLLNPYSASIAWANVHSNKTTLTFDSEAAYTFFVLQWS